MANPHEPDPTGIQPNPVRFRAARYYLEVVLKRVVMLDPGNEAFDGVFFDAAMGFMRTTSCPEVSVHPTVQEVEASVHPTPPALPNALHNPNARGMELATFISMGRGIDKGADGSESDVQVAILRVTPGAISTLHSPKIFVWFAMMRFHDRSRHS